MADITQMLREVRDGDEAALKAVFEAVYPQLRALAASQDFVGPGLTLTPTALVNEAYLKLVNAGELALEDRRHFLLCAARAMRHIAIDHARARSAKRRGGDQERVTLTDVDSGGRDPVDLLDLDVALGDLEAIDPGLRDIVELRYFAGLPMSEIAALYDISLRTANRNWARARAFLVTRLEAP